MKTIILFDLQITLLKKAIVSISLIFTLQSYGNYVS